MITETLVINPEFVAPLYSDAFKSYIDAVASYCRDETFHGAYRLQICWEPQQSTNDSDSREVAASIDVDSTYLWMYVKIYPSILKNWDRDGLKVLAEQILHEICHAFLAPVQELFMWDACESQRGYYQNVIERQTQLITRTVFRLLPKDWWKNAQLLGIDPSILP